MKQFFLFTLCLILFCGSLFSQNCPPNDFATLTKQEEVDNFSINYPNCTQLRFLRIGDDDTSSTITNLTGLTQINSVSNSVFITNNSGLINLNGLENLSVVEKLYISDNEGLIDLEGLEGITELEDITIINNANLISLKGLDSLKSVTGNQSTISFRIIGNSSLSNLTALSSLDTVARFAIMNNDALANLSGLEDFAVEKLIIDNNNNLTSVEGLDNLTAHFSLEIINNDNLSSFNGLANSMVGQLIIDNNVNLTNTGGLESLSANILKIFNNPSLTSLEGLTNINTVISLEVVNNDALTNLVGLENLTYSYDPYYYRKIKISNNDALISLEGLNNLDSVQRLEIIANPVLENLQALEQVTFVRELTVSDNGILTDLSGLENTGIQGLTIRNNDALVDLNALQHLTELYRLELANNNNLTNLTGLNNLTHLYGENDYGGNLVIRDNDNLTDISALSSFTHTESSIFIRNNNSLTNLTGLENITYLRDFIDISNNPVLSDISALNILPYYGNVSILKITKNYNLSMCSYEGICYYLASGRTAYINNNALGCSTPDEILDMCDLNNAVCPIGDITLTSQSQVDSFFIDYPGCSRIDSNLTITGPSITNVDALNQLLTIGGNLIISNNSSLTNLNSLSDIVVEGDFIFKNNDAFIEIENRFNIKGGVYIEDNDALRDILDMTIYIPDVTYLQIVNNPNLSMCGVGYDPFLAVFEDVCNYLWQGKPSQIFNNAVGCNSIEDIELSCIFLPITLTYFQAKIHNKTTLLTWATATETNNAGFEIQRSKDGTNWQKIAWQDGRGTTTNPHTYTYRDENPLFGISYYRLKQVDFDGAYEYSDIVQVNYQGRDISIYPNPVKNTLHISDLNGENIEHISIYDQTGRAVLLQHAPDNAIDVSALLAGMYILKIGVKEEVFCEKFIIQAR